MPPCIPSWVRALAEVDTSEKNLVKHAKGVIGFSFPDPRGIVNSNNRSMYIASWLAARSYHMWQTCLAGDGTRLVSSQQWRDYLHAIQGLLQQGNGSDFPPPMEPPHQLAAMKRRGKKKMNTLNAAHPLLSNSPDLLYFHETTIMFGSMAELQEQLDVDISANVIWELYEHNFRFELLTLDRTLAPLMWEGLEGETGLSRAAVRDNDVLSVFSHEDSSKPYYLVTSFPSKNVGLAAINWKARAPHIFALRRLMKAWKGCPINILYAVEELTEGVSEYAVNTLESWVAEFYCQSFFNYFGRAAIVPHRIPPKAPKACKPHSP